MIHIPIILPLPCTWQSHTERFSLHDQLGKYYTNIPNINTIAFINRGLSGDPYI